MPTEQTLGHSKTECPFFLSERQREVLGLAASGLTDRAIARRLARSPRTVRDHLQRARRALAALNTTHAVAIAIAWGLIDLEMIRRHRAEGWPGGATHKSQGERCGSI